MLCQDSCSSPAEQHEKPKRQTGMGGVMTQTTLALLV